ncbi:hypothetical protein MPSEU_000982400 [Mayamaea pseudoterrestris]|nr:hypothetical protein MPSEU_000982400 [Mayamaea pseudoterrestris]
MKQETRTFGSFWSCGSLLPEDEVNTLTGFLTCKAPDAPPAAAATTVTAKQCSATNQDPVTSNTTDASSRPYQRTSSPARPWAMQVGSSDAPIDMRDAASTVATPIEPKRPAREVKKTTMLRELRQQREATPTRVERPKTATPPVSDDNSITEKAAPHFPGPEVAYRHRRTPEPEQRRVHNMRLSPEGRIKSTLASSKNQGTGIELRKVFENEEFVTFRKVAYSGKTNIPFSMHDSELEPDSDDSQSRKSSSHQVLVVTKKRYPR